MTTYLTPPELAAALTLRDLSDRAAGPHAMQLLLDAVLDRLRTAWLVPHDVRRTSPLVTVSDNYDHLGYAPTAITRDRRYSRYVSPTVMLRSHTSAGIPAALRSMSAADDDLLLVLPGLVYRRDVIDRTHVGAPHQVDLWRIRSGHPLGVDKLDAMIGNVVDAVLPGARWRSVPTAHPYTTAGRQVDVWTGDDWLELLECGLAAPHVLARAGLDPDRRTGLALGMGLDRALLLRKGIPDIRLLRATDPRAVDQLLDLAPWRPMSVLPPIRRDLSLVLAADADVETLGDRVRTALGDRADDLESVQLLARSGYAELPDGARHRLGLRPDQVNALVRIVLRPLDRTLTDAEANARRDAVYLALHEGPSRSSSAPQPDSGGGRQPGEDRQDQRHGSRGNREAIVMDSSRRVRRSASVPGLRQRAADGRREKGRNLPQKRGTPGRGCRTQLALPPGTGGTGRPARASAARISPRWLNAWG
jgi:phenylalanyl-tRNA synthetase alpha chain